MGAMGPTCDTLHSLLLLIKDHDIHSYMAYLVRYVTVEKVKFNVLGQNWACYPHTDLFCVC